MSNCALAPARCVASYFPLGVFLTMFGCLSKEARPVRVYAPEAPPSAIRLEPIVIPALEKVIAENGRDAQEYALLEIVGCGLGAFDYDLDGRCDLYFPCGGVIDGELKQIHGKPSVLVRNNGPGEADDVSDFSRCQASDLYSHGVSVADLNEDGFGDLIVYGFHGVRLFFNQGDGTFMEHTLAAGMSGLPWTSAMAVFDANADGILDIYGASYADWSFENHPKCDGWFEGDREVCPPAGFAGMPDWFLVGNGDGTFSRSDETFVPLEVGRGLGTLAFRRKPESNYSDLYVANDMMNNVHFMMDNQGVYQDEALLLGNAVDVMGFPNASMGVALLDVNGDCAFDLFVTNFDHEYMALYTDAGAEYKCETLNFGLAKSFPPQVAFGVVTPDLDCDGDEDIYVVCGGVEYNPSIHKMEQPAVLLENVDQKRLYRMKPHDYFDTKEVGRGAVQLDWNNDGYPDVGTSQLWHAPHVLLNKTEHKNAFLKIRLIGTAGTRTPIGAIVQVVTKERKLVRQHFGGGSYCSQSEEQLFFGLGDAEEVDLTIHWPSGTTQQMQGVQVNQQLTIIEATKG